MNATEIAARNHQRAVRFLWCWLMGTAAASIGGNIAAAILPTEYDRSLKAALAIIPPVVVLCAIHSMALLVRANVSGRVYWSFVAGTAALAIGAFALSFVALHALALMAGISGWVAVALPLLLDLGMALATLGLVAIGEKPQRRIRGARKAQSIGGATTNLTEIRTETAAETATVSVQSPAEFMPQQNTNPKAGDPLRPVSAKHSNGKFLWLAETDLEDFASRIAGEGRTTQPRETVLAVLDALASGASINGAAGAAGINYDTSQRIANAAAAARTAAPVTSHLTAV